MDQVETEIECPFKSKKNREKVNQLKKVEKKKEKMK